MWAAYVITSSSLADADCGRWGGGLPGRSRHGDPATRKLPARGGQSVFSVFPSQHYRNRRPERRRYLGPAGRGREFAHVLPDQRHPRCRRSTWPRAGGDVDDLAQRESARFPRAVSRSFRTGGLIGARPWGATFNGDGVADLLVVSPINSPTGSGNTIVASLVTLAGCRRRTGWTGATDRTVTISERDRVERHLRVLRHSGGHGPFRRYKASISAVTGISDIAMGGPERVRGLSHRRARRPRCKRSTPSTEPSTTRSDVSRIGRCRPAPIS